MFKKMFAICALAFSSVSAVAGPIYLDHENENYWTSVDLGLDFMDLTQTEGMTYEQIQAETVQGGLFDGWRLASAQESQSLYTIFASGDPAINGWSSQHYDNALLWFRLFGHSSIFDGVWDTRTDEPTGYVNWVQVFNADKLSAHVAIDTMYGKEGWFSQQGTNFTAWPLDENYQNTPYAGLMTRASSASTPVSEPEPMVLMLLGSFLLLVGRLTSRKRA